MGQSVDEYLDAMRGRFDAAQEKHREAYVRETFHSIDADGSGMIDHDEFRSVCLKIDPTLTDADIDDAVEIIDDNSDGEVSFEEFRAWWESDHAVELREKHDELVGKEDMDEVELVERWESKKRELAEAALKRTFNNVDADGSGEIDVEEFRTLCRRLDARIELPAVEEAWELIDEDKSGEVDYREFCRWWESENGRRLRGVKPEEVQAFTYKELITAVKRRAEEIRTKKQAEQIERRARLAAGKAARQERRDVAAADAAAAEQEFREAQELAIRAQEQQEQVRCSSQRIVSTLENRVLQALLALKLAAKAQRWRRLSKPGKYKHAKAKQEHEIPPEVVLHGVPEIELPPGMRRVGAPGHHHQVDATDSGSQGDRAAPQGNENRQQRLRRRRQEAAERLPAAAAVAPESAKQEQARQQQKRNERAQRRALRRARRARQVMLGERHDGVPPTCRAECS